MTEHKSVVISVLNRLYRRIDEPSPADARLRVIALKALDAMEQPGARFEYDVLNAKEAREAVEAGLIAREEALVKELAGKNRAKLVEWLQKGGAQ